jgi:hypothetical protein
VYYFHPEKSNKTGCTYRQEEEILSIQETGGKLKPEHKGFLCPEKNMNMNMMMIMMILYPSTLLPV